MKAVIKRTDLDENTGPPDWLKKPAKWGGPRVKTMPEKSPFCTAHG
jgi:hypothetical protein